MKIAAVATSVLMLSVGLAAQGPPVKGQTKSAITVAITTLGCSTSVGTNAFDVGSWSWGATNPGDLVFGGGGGSGKVSVSDLSVMKGFDGCSPALFGAVATGKFFPTLTLTQSNSDGTATTVTLTEVRVSSWQASGSTTSASPAESVSFAFAKVCLADGASGAKFCWDVKGNKAF